jgi:hypothetical protein
MDDTDPRSLPLLPFDLGDRKHDDLRLDSEEGRRDFDGAFGPSRARCDAADVIWRLNPRAYHGGDTLATRGRPLPQGLHWDVQVERRTCLIKMATEVWQLKRNQYLNIYPDLHVRTTRKGPRRWWPKTT